MATRLTSYLIRKLSADVLSFSLDFSLADRAAPHIYVNDSSKQDAGLRSGFTTQQKEVFSAFTFSPDFFIYGNIK